MLYGVIGHRARALGKVTLDAAFTRLLREVN